MQMNLEYTHTRQSDNKKLYNCPTYEQRKRILHDCARRILNVQRKI